MKSGTSEEKCAAPDPNSCRMSSFNELQFNLLGALDVTSANAAFKHRQPTNHRDLEFPRSSLTDVVKFRRLRNLSATKTESALQANDRHKC